MIDQTIDFDADLIKRYDGAGPRYTSYPTAVQFNDSMDNATYERLAKDSNAGGSPLSLYFHIPFCNTVCFYCACNKIASKDYSKGAPYLERVYKEMAMQSALFDDKREVEQLHWGGGTPTFISHDEMTQLMENTGKYFQLKDDDTGEYSIEIDPREADESTITLLRQLGFNRLSLGVQDFDPVVQKAVNRIQSLEETKAVVDAARGNNFKSVSVDLIYGLPFQSSSRFLNTLETVLEMDPDRISIFNYAHLPKIFKPQRRINETDLPVPAEKLLIFQQAIQYLIQAGYVYIGMDHFAKPEDELAQAQRNGSLYRNFQGYSTHADCDMISLGVTSIGKVGNSYSQNQRDINEYYNAIDSGKLAVFRGIELNDDDVLRREVISQLMCHFRLDIKKIEQQFKINFMSYFADALPGLATMQQDGLLNYDNHCIEVKPAGKLLIRSVCMLFDAYIKQSQQSFSKVI